MSDRTAERSSESLSLFLCGDVMTGRGIDQVQRCPSDPSIYEPDASSALAYIGFAEERNGPIPRAVEPSYVWGDALAELASRQPDVRLVNLETSVTTNAEPVAKEINYRMHPGNIGVLQAAGIDCCVLANNHALDWGVPGLVETLDALREADIAVAGAGRTSAAAAEPAVAYVAEGCRVLIFGFGVRSSGIPADWAATASRPGIRFLPDLSDDACQNALQAVRAHRREGDLVVASIHWGANWRQAIRPGERRFAHALIDSGCVDAVHGHSSHHVRGIEIYRDRPIFYGCGDFINDYEGIGRGESRRHKNRRPDLVLAYFPRFERQTRVLSGLELVPFRLHRFRLERASKQDSTWLRRELERQSKPLGTRVELRADGVLVI